MSTPSVGPPPNRERPGAPATGGGADYDDSVTRKAAPFSLRLSAKIDRLITDEATRTRRSKGSLIASLVEEALRTRLVPGVAFRDEDHNRRAWLMGTSLDVWQVIDARTNTWTKASSE
jgi:hypothetical protein